MSNLAKECQKLCDSGKCLSECCGVVPFDVLLFNKYAYRAGVKKWKKLELMQDKTGNKFITAITKDLSCIFLDKGACSIYDERPSVCRKFGDETHEMLKCPHLDKNGDKRKTIDK